MDLSLFGLVPLLFGGAPDGTPKALIEEVYQPLTQGEAVPMEQFYSARLQGLVADNVAGTVVDGDGARIDPTRPDIVAFNPFLNGDAGPVDGLAVTEPIVEGDEAVALVSFRNATGPTTLTISMVNEAEGWRVDDIASVGAGENWLYSWLLQYDPFSER